MFTGLSYYYTTDFILFQLAQNTLQAQNSNTVLFSLFIAKEGLSRHILAPHVSCSNFFFFFPCRGSAGDIKHKIGHIPLFLNCGKFWLCQCLPTDTQFDCECDWGIVCVQVSNCCHRAPGRRWGPSYTLMSFCSVDLQKLLHHGEGVLQHYAYRSSQQGLELTSLPES